MLNKAILIGNLGNKPDVKQMNRGENVVNISLATNRKWTDKNGEKKEQVEWHRVTCFNSGNFKLADIAAKYLKKGSKCYVKSKNFRVLNPGENSTFFLIKRISEL